MRKVGRVLLHICNLIAIVLFSNLLCLVRLTQMEGAVPIICLIVLALIYVCINVFPSFFLFRYRKRRLQNCAEGCELLILFIESTVISALFSLIGWVGLYKIAPIWEETAFWIWNTVVIYCAELILFWNGIIRVYTSSEQLGMRYRVLGIVCGMIPVAHLVALGIILYIVEKEIHFEQKKLLFDEARKEQQLCHTRYPVLLIHGVFFRDSRYLNYWGRIPEELEKNGATLFYGNQQSAVSVEESGAELSARIKQIVEETGCEKVNIIAHSKGGLDSRYAISVLGAAPYVASLTTINTPHRGCEFAEYLLSKAPESTKKAVATTYNSTLHKLGDKNPDFLQAVFGLTVSECQRLNELMPDKPEVYYQSVGSKMNVAYSGRFPLNFSYHLVKHFDGENDGLVGKDSFPWGADFTYLTVKGKRGISHGDMIDLNRENFDGFDVREFYVQLLYGLKKRGF